MSGASLDATKNWLVKFIWCNKLLPSKISMSLSSSSTSTFAFYYLTGHIVAARLISKIIKHF